MDSRFVLRHASYESDAAALADLYNHAFPPEEQVGTLAETFYFHLPGLKPEHWYMVEDTENGVLASALILIPWQWELDGIRLHVAEMGVVGTRPEYRRQGLFAALGRDFDRSLDEGEWDLAAIQGIPGFYQRFGYSYAVPLENHINLPLHLAPDQPSEEPFQFRLAAGQDIPFLEQQDEAFRSSFALASYRDRAHWHYLLNESRRTEYGSEFWIMERPRSEETYYFRVPAQGFGEGLIISEISEPVSPDAFRQLCGFCRTLAVERGKPYLRFNVSSQSAAGELATASGATPGMPYAWQIKIRKPERLLRNLVPLLEKRLQGSSMRGYSGIFRLNFYSASVDLKWLDGRLVSLDPGEETAADGFSIPPDLFPAVCLGHATWRALRVHRPDLIAGSPEAALLMDALFPPVKSWIHEQY